MGIPCTIENNSLSDLNMQIYSPILSPIINYGTIFPVIFSSYYILQSTPNLGSLEPLYFAYNFMGQKIEKGASGQLTLFT